MQDQLRKTYDDHGCSRRGFLHGIAGAVTAGPLLDVMTALADEQPAAKPSADKPAPQEKIKLGMIGCGGRGSWIAPLFLRHGGYVIHAAADYFPDAVETFGEKFGVPAVRRFSGLNGYRRVIESGVDAVVIIVPPYFASYHVAAAAEAGLHVWVAKPSAIDVPGCHRLEEANKAAQAHRKVFFVDYQMHTDPVNIEVAARLRRQEAGKIAKISTIGISGGHNDPPKTATIESRLRHGIWSNDLALSGSLIVEYDIHAIDAVIWLLSRRPVAALGSSAICRADPHGDSHDVCSVIFEYEDGLLHEHSGVALPTGAGGELSCRVFCQFGHAVLTYTKKARFHRRGQEPFAAEVENLYEAGAVRNIASFYEDVIAGRCENPTVRRAIDGCLTCILGREAGFRKGRLTMAELLAENKPLEADLTGLKE